MRARCEGGSINGSSDGHEARAAPAPRRTRASGSRGQRAHPRRRPPPGRGEGGPIFLFGLRPNKEDEKQHTNNIQEGQGEGLPNKGGLLSPTLSSIVPLEERERAPCALKEEFCLARPERFIGVFSLLSSPRYKKKETGFHSGLLANQFNVTASDGRTGCRWRPRSPYRCCPSGPA